MNGMFISKSRDHYSKGSADSDSTSDDRAADFERITGIKETNEDRRWVDSTNAEYMKRKASEKPSPIPEPSDSSYAKSKNRFGFAKGTVSLKKKKKNKFAKVMKEGYAGKLHSGKAGPVVTKPAQMKAIAASEAGMSRKMPAPSGIRFTPKG